MSAQFGTWHFNGDPIDAEYMRKARSAIEPYGPHDGAAYTQGNIGILFRALHTTKESVREKQPHVSTTGTVIVWDGRLDNREELVSELQGAVSTESTDILIVAAAFERWNIRCFARLLGDWALSVWDSSDRSLILAKDPIGARHLYYLLGSEQITWASTLDSLVLFARKPLLLDEEYVAGWLSAFPPTDRTPYANIRSVPPSSFVHVWPARCVTTQYWDFDPHNVIRYRTDAQFEEHFRSVFKTSVRRRLRSNAPILAELSGGMDSSSAVCVADAIIGAGIADTPRLDTISYYNESEPNWDERPYFEKVEQTRGRKGCHINTGSLSRLAFQFDEERFAPTPSCKTFWTEPRKQVAALLSSQGNRVVISGIGGDEIMGGVPTPAPELADLLAKARLKALARQLKAWALSTRKPWFHLLFDVAREFCPRPLLGPPEYLRSWLDPQFVERNRLALMHRPRLKLSGPPPSFQENIHTMGMLRRQLACMHPSTDLPCEKRYPYLDRDLLEFVFAIPRDQIVRPNERRSLMRRSLRGLVPEEILNRRRKAFVSQAPLLAISAALPEMSDMRDALQLGSLGLVDVARFVGALERATRGVAPTSLLLMRAIWLENWLEHASHWGVFSVASTRL